jgi:hypothetical protein
LSDDNSESTHHTEVTTIDSTTELTTVDHKHDETHTTTVETTTKLSEVTHTSTMSTAYTTTSHEMVTESSTVHVDNSVQPKNKTISRPQQSKIVKMFECSK